MQTRATRQHALLFIYHFWRKRKPFYSLQYTGGITLSGGLAVNVNTVVALLSKPNVTIATSVTSMVVTYNENGIPNCAVTAVAETALWQRWQQYQCVSDVNWQRCNNDDSDNAVTLMCTPVWQWWQLSALWKRCNSCDSDVRISLTTMCTSPWK